MPGEPMAMPSETVMVLKSTPLPPAASAPATASRASSPICMLQGVTLAHVEAMPICGLAKSSSLKPTALSMEREGVCLIPSTTSRECSRGSIPRVFAIAPRTATQKCEPFSLALVARPDQLEEAAYALRFRAHGPPGTLLAVPRIEVQMQPVRRLGDKPLQK